MARCSSPPRSIRSSVTRTPQLDTNGHPAESPIISLEHEDDSSIFEHSGHDHGRKSCSSGTSISYSEPQTDLEDSTQDDHEPSLYNAHDKRLSHLTTTSISTFPGPDSAFPSDIDEEEEEEGDEDEVPHHTSARYSTPRAFRTPSSVRRLQLSTPSPTSLSPSRRLRGTPRVRRSPFPRTKARHDEIDSATGPLVLLHITLLPVSLPWSMSSMRGVLGAEVEERLRLLRSKATETVLRRGLLIRHPREEFEVLEERLLEALELGRERVTKCGHFLGRCGGGAGGSDSGFEETDAMSEGCGNGCEGVGEWCGTCDREVREGRNGVGEGRQRWDVKVYAANGLMRAGAWAAAWSEMERVDVEVTPWIPEEMRKRLDEIKAVEDAEEYEEEQLERQLERERERDMASKVQQQEMVRLVAQSPPPVSNTAEVNRPRSRGKAQGIPSPAPAADLPQAYRPKEIPLDVLIRNYVYLLAKDRRNAVIGVLTLIVVMLLFRSTPPPLAPFPNTGLCMLANSSTSHSLSTGHAIAATLANPIGTPSLEISPTFKMVPSDVPTLVGTAAAQDIIADDPSIEQAEHAILDMEVPKGSVEPSAAYEAAVEDMMDIAG
ncbi:hypothetical protein M8818_007516 [Zalaria obscura]|uniref:Uncharacterized protein n=1 Tax=Zalaria obscura TaxID=2024903 RepID=A0ACC3S463_9PEZI